MGGNDQMLIGKIDHYVLNYLQDEKEF